MRKGTMEGLDQVRKTASSFLKQKDACLREREHLQQVIEDSNVWDGATDKKTVKTVGGGWVKDTKIYFRLDEDWQG